MDKTDKTIETLVEISALKILMDKSSSTPEMDALVEGVVIDIQKSSVYVDLAPFGTGIIYGREFINARDIIKKIGLGDIVKAKINIY